jgi:hypothetical protein
MEPVLKNLSDDPALDSQVDYADGLRGFRGKVRSLRQRQGKSTDIGNEKELVFQKWYMQGRMPDGSATFEEHQKSLNLRSFEDQRGNRA